MWTILLDIDGTLLRTKGAGLAALKLAAEELFGFNEPFPKIEVHGRTDVGILGDLFEGQKIDWQADLPKLFRVYSGYLRDNLGAFEGHVFEGVVEFLKKLRARDDVAIGLLTGNCREAAQAKIHHFQLQDYIDDFGGFGCSHADRNVVAENAKRSAANFLGDVFDERKIWVVGDTQNDIRCGRAIGAKVLAVATGGVSYDELLQLQPDICVADLREPSLLNRMAGTVASP